MSESTLRQLNSRSAALSAFRVRVALPRKGQYTFDSKFTGGTITKNKFECILIDRAGDYAMAIVKDDQGV